MQANMPLFVKIIPYMTYMKMFSFVNHVINSAFSIQAIIQDVKYNTVHYLLKEL